MESDTTIDVKRSEYEKTSEEATSTGSPPQFSRNEELARLEVAVLAAILVLALLGNGLVACILRKVMTRQKLTRMNLMIGHLAAADTAVALFNVLPQMAWKITFAFYGGNMACKLVAYGQLAVMYGAAYVLVATAIDRYLAICHPLTTHVWNTYRINMLVASVWTVALMFALPQLFIFAYDEKTVLNCQVYFYSDWAMTAYITWATAAIYVVPLLVLVVVYSRICSAVWRSDGFKRRAMMDPNGRGLNSLTSNSLGDSTSYCGVDCRQLRSVSNSTARDVQRCGGGGDFSSRLTADRCPSYQLVPIRCNASETGNRSTSRRHTSGVGEKPHLSSAKLKTVKLTLVVVASYVICYGPYFTVQIWAAWDYNAPYEGPAITIISLLASLNSCVNPLIYMAFNYHVIRRLLSRAVSCCFTRRNGRGNDAHVPPSGDIHRRNIGPVSASSPRVVTGSFAVVRQSYHR